MSNHSLSKVLKPLHFESNKAFKWSLNTTHIEDVTVGNKTGADGGITNMFHHNVKCKFSNFGNSNL